jgi:50S ribosomal subunit-associated GTPase HflX
MQMIDVHLPTTDGRTIILSRYTQPEADLQLLLKQLKLELPRATAAQNHGPRPTGQIGLRSEDF